MSRLFIAFSSAAMLVSCTVYRDVEVHGVRDLQVVKMGADGIDLNVWVDVENPNWYRIRLTESNIQLFFEGKNLGTVTLNEKLTVPKKSRAVQPMSVHTDMSDIDALLGNVFSLLFKQRFEVIGKGYVKGRACFVVRKVDAGFTHYLTREDLGF